MSLVSLVSPVSPRPSTVALAAALTVALAACGGGSDSSASTSRGPSGIVESDASAWSSTSLNGARAVSTASDAVYTAVADLVGQNAVHTMGTTRHAAAFDSAAPSTTSSTGSDTTFAVRCDLGGSATITVSGGTAGTQADGLLEVGETYTVVYDACVMAANFVKLDGTVAMTVNSVSSTNPDDVSVGMSFTQLQASAFGGTTTLDGSLSLDHTTTTADTGDTVRASHVAASALSLTTGWNNRSASLTMTDASFDLAVDETSGYVLQSLALDGSWSMSGTVAGRDFSDSVVVDSQVIFDASGNPTSGTWSSTNSQGTVTAKATSTAIELDVDDGSDGTVDHTWTLDLSSWAATAG